MRGGTPHALHGPSWSGVVDNFGLIVFSFISDFKGFTHFSTDGGQSIPVGITLARRVIQTRPCLPHTDQLILPVFRPEFSHYSRRSHDRASHVNKNATLRLAKRIPENKSRCVALPDRPH